MTGVADDPPLTVLLSAWSQGDAQALAQLMQQLHGGLLRMAASRLRGAGNSSLSCGDVLHQALLRLMEAPPAWQSRAHFFGTVSLTMRSVLVDHARARLRDKRGGGLERVTWTLLALGEESMAADLLTLDRLLDQLQAEDPRAANILHLTYFAGLEREAIAEVLGLSQRTVDRDLRFARAWLSEQLGRDLQA